jgi:hypothetical protein
MRTVTVILASRHRAAEILGVASLTVGLSLQNSSVPLADRLPGMAELTRGVESGTVIFGYFDRRLMAQRFERWARKIEAMSGATARSERAFSPEVRNRAARPG